MVAIGDCKSQLRCCPKCIKRPTCQSWHRFDVHALLSSLDLAINQDIKSRVTYSVVARRLHDDVMREFIHRELDRLGLAHSTFTSGATELIILSADGVGSAWERTVFEAPPLPPPLPPSLTSTTTSA